MDSGIGSHREEEIGRGEGGRVKGVGVYTMFDECERIGQEVSGWGGEMVEQAQWN